MTTPINSILVVGGGTAGWITAAIIAAKHHSDDANAGVHVTLIEAPDIPTIGVGEGTWPSMRATLRSIGVKESDFLKECQASFKQGSKFVGWKNGSAEDAYYHPFELPQGFLEVNLAQYWIDQQPAMSFSKMACVQEAICEQNLSPKLRSTGDFAGVVNYGYHLNAGKFAEYIKKHCIEKLGVRLVYDKVTEVVADDSGDIEHVLTEQSGALGADLFVDCTGFKSLLLGQHFGIELHDLSADFPINTALATQVAYRQSEPVKSVTISTAQPAGWVWDIGLSSRRGVGYVYSDSHSTSETATRQLQSYLGLDDKSFAELELRKLKINPGYRKKFWHKNCVAVGLSAGFLEPLEASAIMLIEVSAKMIADQLPSTRSAMDTVAKRFNRRNQFRWQRIVDFLKLHYALSNRPEPFWRDAADKQTLSERLREDLELWADQAPWKADFDSLDEAFPVASYQYILYGMGFKARRNHRPYSAAHIELAHRALEDVNRASGLLIPKIESNRTLLDLINAS